MAKLFALLPACLSAATAFAARAVEAVDDYPTMYVPEGYVPSPLDDGDGVAQLVVLAFCAVCGFVGMKLSLDSEQVKSEEALAEKVAKQVAAMRAAPSGPVTGTPVASLAEDAAAATTKFDNEGLLRLDATVSPETAAALLAEVNATLARELERASGGGGLPSDAFGNVYCKGNRYDLKLPWGGVAENALREAAVNMRPFLERAAGGEKARLCEFAALVSDPGSARQPVHPDTNYRRDRCVVTSFVALQDVESDMGPTVFIPGSHTASAHLAFREAGETGGGGARRAARRGDARLRGRDSVRLQAAALRGRDKKVRPSATRRVTTTNVSSTSFSHSAKTLLISPMTFTTRPFNIFPIARSTCARFSRSARRSAAPRADARARSARVDRRRSSKSVRAFFN